MTDRRHQLASLAKLMEGFLDDGPQFVLKLVVVVLYGIGLSTDIREYERVFGFFFSMRCFKRVLFYVFFFKFIISFRSVANRAALEPKR